MSEHTANHPQPEALIDFGLGKLDAEKSSAIEEHLSECEDCCETLLNLQDDTFTGLVRSLPKPSAKTSHDVTDGAVEREESGNAPTMLASSGESDEISELPAELKNHPRYRIVEQIGKGGMGDVFRAEHKLMNRLVALKVINSQLVKHPHAVERFRREVQAAARLAHPNIVTAFDAEQAGDAHFLVMEFVQGRELASLVKERGPLSVSEASDCIRQAAEGLQHAHEHGMVHRDIKPHNLMLSPNGQVRILDFGLAGFASETALIASESNDEKTSQHLTTFGSVMGTPDYIAPEQARDAHSADIRADIYSLGCTLYYLLTGKPPHIADSVADKLKAHAELEPADIRAVRVDVPDELADVIRRMLAKDPAQRFQTPQEIADVLASFVDKSRTSSQEISPAATNGPGSRRTRSAGVLAILMTLVFGLAGIIYVATDNGTLVIESEDENVIITIAQQLSHTHEGFKIKMVDRVTGSEVVRLPSGHYRLAILPSDGLTANFDVTSMRLSQEQFTLSRGGKVIVRITKKPSPVEGGTSQPPPQPVAGNANELPRQIAGHNDKISSLAFSPDGTQLLSGSNSGMLLLHDVATRKQLREFSGHKRSIRSVTFSPDGTRVLSSGWDNTIRMWDIATGLQILVIEDKGDVLHTSAFDPTGKLILSCSHVGAAGAIRLWDAETGNLVREFENVSFQPFEVVFSLTGKQALSGAHDGVMRLWDVETGKVFKTFHGHSDWVRSVAFSKDGQFAVSGSKDNTIRVWDVETGELRRTLTGHTDVVESAVFTPDGHRILSGSLDGTVRLWDVATGEELAGFGSPQRSGNRAAISPDGRTVASGANDKLIRLWQMAELYRIEGDSVLGPAPDKSSRSIEIPKGKRLVTVKIDLSPVHRGQLRAGDKVDVFATHAYLDPLDKEKGPQTKTKRILSEVEIFAFDSGRTPNSRDEDSAGTTVSLLVDPEQAVPLLLAAKKGTLNFKLPEEQLPEAANDAALKWFALLDAGEYGKCWDEMASTAKESLTREGLIAQCERSIKPRGRVLSRTLASVSYNHLDRRNPKVLMDMTYETQFENAGKLTETLLLHRDTDGQWRVGAHGISKPNGDRTDSVGKPAE